MNWEKLIVVLASIGCVVIMLVLIVDDNVRRNKIQPVETITNDELCPSSTNKTVCTNEYEGENCDADTINPRLPDKEMFK